MIIVKGRMLELLTWEPFEKLVSGEKEYIDEILSGNYQQPQSKFHDLFSGFCYYVEQGNANQKKFKDIDWIQRWKSTYCQNQNYTHSTKDDRNRYPLLFKKICFYVIVRGEFTDKEFMAQIGLSVNRISKWGISPKFRKYAEADTYSVIRTFRAGVKKPYIVSIVKKLYYEAGRQVSKSTTLKKLPTFVDVFAGTASVAASVVTDGCPPPIINDFDPVMVCFAWAFTHYQREICKKIVEFHDYLRRGLTLTACNYNAAAYEYHNEKNDSGNLYKDPKAWDDPRPGIQWLRREVYKYSKEYTKNGKRLALRHQELIMRIRSGYKDVKLVLNKLSDGDRERLRDAFNKLSKHTPDSQKGPELEDILDYALALFFYYSFRSKGVHTYYETNVDVNSYLLFLNSLQVDLSDVRNKNLAVEADNLLKLQLKASSLTLESKGNFSRHLRNAKFYCQDFRDILQNGPETERVYYLDSPYFLTVGYKVGFDDDDHKDMLDLLRKAEFKWIFSMQYKPSETCDYTTGADKAKRKRQPHIIKNYKAYYRGFYAPFKLEADPRVYVETDAPVEDAKKLYAILFDVDTAKAKEQEIYPDTREMLVVNFNCLPTIPMHDSAVVLPFDLFLQCADDGVAYSEIVKRAIAWRKSYIENNYTGKDAV